MKDSLFPIVEIKENTLISTDGNIGHFYKIYSPDREQLTKEEVESFYDGVLKSLNNFENDSYYKFYRLNGENFIESNQEGDPFIEGVNLTKSERHLESFFGRGDLFSDIIFYDDYLYFNGSYLKVLSVKEFSEEEIDQHLIPIDIDYVLTIKKEERGKSLKRLDFIRSKHLTSFLKTKRDISGEGSYSQAEGLIEEITHGNEFMFKMGLFFLVRGESLDEVNKKTRDLINHFSLFGIKLYLEGNNPLKFKSGLPEVFNDLIPGVRPSFKYRDILNKTSHLKFLLPLYFSGLMNEGVKLSDKFDQIILFNPFERSLKNKNMLVTGSSGGGKSVLVNKLIHNLIDHHPCVIIDIGGSFKRLTYYHDGVELNLGINPLQFRDPFYLRELILSVVDRDRFNKLERGRLYKEICTFLSESKSESFDDLLNFLEKEFLGISLYFEDIKDYFRGQNVKSGSILYVDIENYPKSIIAPLIIYLLEYFKNIEAKEKILVLDECWAFLKDHHEFIDKCFRTFRKSGALPIAIGQGISDFKNSEKEIYNSIINNSYFKIYFPQDLSMELTLDNFDRKKINSLSFRKDIYSEAYLRSNDQKIRKALRIYLSPLEYELFQTSPEEEGLLEAFLEKNREFFKSNKEAVDAFIGLKYGKDHHNFNDSNSYIWS